MATQQNKREVGISASDRAFEYAKIYQLRKEERLKKIAKEERLKRKLVAKPMPNFNVIRNPVRSYEHAELVSPETPDVLKRSLAVKEKLRQKHEEHLKKLTERPPIVAREADVLKRKPFEPILAQKVVTAVEPFYLTERLAQRKEEDNRRHQEKALREEKLAKENKEKEEEIKKRIRQQNTFKARLNPFKRRQCDR